MRSFIRISVSIIAAFLFQTGIYTLQSAMAQCAMESPNKGKVLISEFRTTGSDGANDEFIELYNNTDSSISLSGWSIWQLTTTVPANSSINRMTFSASATIPARGHYLVASVDYSLTAYATRNAALGAFLSNNAGIGLFDNNVTGAPSCATRVDVVGFNNSSLNGGSAAPLYFDNGGAATALTTISGTINIEHSFVRIIDKTTTLPVDTDNNSADFVLVSTTPAINTMGRTGAIGAPDGPPVLGAAGPENSGAATLAVKSPTNQTNNYVTALFDTSRTQSQTPNRCYDSADTSPGAGAKGSLFIRRNLTNSSGTSAQLRFRVIDITTVNSPGSTNTSQSIIKPVTSTGGTANCPNQLFNGTSATVQDTTLEPPSVSTGGGMNSSLSTTPVIAPTENRNVLFRLAADRTGSFRFYFIIEGR